MAKKKGIRYRLTIETRLPSAPPEALDTTDAIEVVEQDVTLDKMIEPRQDGPGTRTRRKGTGEEEPPATCGGA